MIFSSTNALERCTNEVSHCFFFFDYPPSDKILTVQGRRLISNLAKNSPKPIIIVNDPLIFTQPESDVHISNFGVDKCWTLARAIATLVWKAHHRIQWRSHRPCRQSPTLTGQLQYSFQYGLDGQSLFVYGWWLIRNFVRQLVFEVVVKNQRLSKYEAWTKTARASWGATSSRVVKWRRMLAYKTTSHLVRMQLIPEYFRPNLWTRSRC